MHIVRNRKTKLSRRLPYCGFSFFVETKTKSRYSEEKMEEIHTMEIETDDTVPPPAKGSAVPSESDPYILSFSFDRPTYDGVIIGRVYGRNWKQVR
ncbi:hypothetical protein RYX36_002405 [Vicia faba]